jgi:hypothetical protein
MLGAILLRPVASGLDVATLTETAGVDTPMDVSEFWLSVDCSIIGSQLALAQTLPTHRIPAVLALEAVGKAVATCAPHCTLHIEHHPSAQRTERAPRLSPAGSSCKREASISNSSWSSPRLALLPGALLGRGRAVSAWRLARGPLLTSIREAGGDSLFLARIVGRIDVVDARWPNELNLSEID